MDTPENDRLSEAAITHVDEKTTSLVKWTTALATLDRRWIFLLMAIAVAVPTLMKLRFPEQPTGLSRATFEQIESLEDGSLILLAFDFEPASEGELGPMATSFVRHCCEKNHRMVFMCLWPLGDQMISDRIADVIEADYPEKAYGIDFVNLGFKSGNEGVMKVVATDFGAAYSVDSKRKVALDQLPIMRGVESVKSFDLIINVSAGYPGTKEWVQYAATPRNVPIVGGATGVQSPGLYPYYPAQLKGLLAAIKGAADYEKLVDDAYGENPRYTEARLRMGPQLVAHVLVIGLILAGNVIFFLQRRIA